MKKVFAVLTALSLVIAIAGCNLLPANEAANSITDNTQGNQPSQDASIADNTEKLASNPSAKQLNVNETVTVGNAMEITLESSEWVEEIKPSNTQGSYSYLEDQDGEKYFVIKGKIKNLSGEDLDVSYKAMEASLLINGTYNADIHIESEEADGTGFYCDIKPLQTLNVIFYASVSDELQAICENAEMTLKVVNDAAYISEYFYEDEVPFNTYSIKFGK